MLKGRKNSNINFDSNTFYSPVYSISLQKKTRVSKRYSNAAERAVDIDIFYAVIHLPVPSKTYVLAFISQCSVKLRGICPWIHQLYVLFFFVI